MDLCNIALQEKPTLGPWTLVICPLTILQLHLCKIIIIILVYMQEAQEDVKRLEGKIVSQTAELRDSQAKEQELKVDFLAATSIQIAA